MLLSILYFILMLGVIVFVHEFGHFFFAKLFGIYVYEFSIGMGPKIFSWQGKGKETTYSLRLIPIGGFCQLAGEGAEEDTKLPKDRLLQSKPAWQRFLVMFFGAGNNFLLAIIILFFIGLILGSSYTNTTVSEVELSSPAYTGGLQVNDQILKIDGNTTKTSEDVKLYFTIAKGETEVVVLRDNQEVTLKMTPILREGINGEENYYGLNLETKVEYGFWNAIKYSFSEFGALTRYMFNTFKSLFTGSISVKQLSGPVGIYSAVDKMKEYGFASIISLMALLSLNVGFVNLIPFPAFDGGRILFLIIEKLRGKPVKAETENLIHNIGFFILLALIIYVTINDIIKLF